MGGLWDSLDQWLVILNEENEVKIQQNEKFETSVNDNSSSVDPVSNDDKRKSLHMLSVTSDRLCAIICAYYMCIKCTYGSQGYVGI